MSSVDDKYGIIIQARLGSSRLPRKVLLDIEGQPMLLRQLQRLRHLSKIDKIIVATTQDAIDDEIEHLCRQNGFDFFRGPLNDVMDRFILCALKFKIDFIIRVGGDDPLIDPQCCNHLMALHKKQAYEFMYASHREGWPYGSAAELIALSALEKIHVKISNLMYLEHTIPYFFDHPYEFSVLKVKAPKELNRPDYCFTVDYPEDFQLVCTIFKKLKSEGDYFTLNRVIQLIDENPDLRNINKHLHKGFDR